MRITVAALSLLCLLAAFSATALAQTDEQQLSAEEFLGLDSATSVEGNAPPTVDGQAPAIDPKAAEIFGDGEGKRKRQMTDRSIVKLRTIDKLSARTHTFDIPVSKTVKFGKSLFIKARACRSASALDEPENAAFLQIWERLPEPDPRTGDESRWIFSGWMFSSSPSLSAMEHPIYDVWVIECKNDATVAAAETYSAEKAPETAPEEAAADAATAAPETKEAATGETPVASPVVVEGTPEAETTPEQAAPAPRPDPVQMAPVAPVSGGSAAVPTLQELPGSFEDSE